MGRLASGSKLLPLPLEARVGKSAFAPLNTPVESQLDAAGPGAGARGKATVNLRQQVKGKASGQLPQGPARHAFHGHTVGATRATNQRRTKEIPEVKLVRSRLVAGALGLAVAGTATGSVIASADEAAPVAKAAQQGGVSITPASVERTAKRGAVGTITVKNTTKDTMRVTINVRPWIQNRNTGAVVLNTKASLSPYVRAVAADVQPAAR